MPVSLPREVAVVGAGTMGAGIAQVFAGAGCAVRLCARRAASLAGARARLGELAGRVRATQALEEAVAGAELVIETIVEELEPKRQLLTAAERAAPDAILVSNTSSLSLAQLSDGLERPERFAGLHWFNPPEVVDVVEVIGTDATEPEVLATLAGWLEGLGKVPVVLSRDVPGFLVNRLQYALIREAWELVERGVCSFEDVDRAITYGLGPRWAALGPFQSVDLAGLDIHLAVVRNLYGELSTAGEPPPTLVDAVGRGLRGAKGGEGLLGRYPPERLAAIAARRVRIADAVAAARADDEPQ